MIYILSGPVLLSDLNSLTVSSRRFSEFCSRAKQCKLSIILDHLLSCCDISGSHSGVADDSLLGCGATSFSV